jgi:uncharacterized membrane protein YraQ (UPF0718 family)
VAVSWALLDPLLTVVRPVAAFLTAFAAGIAQNLLGHRPHGDGGPSPLPVALPTPPLRLRLRDGMMFVWHELLPMLAGWLLLMVVLTGILDVLLPEDLVVSWIGTGWFAMVLMLVISVPIYVCATSSTPIAAALIAKGLSPGAALVFLLAGPATNLATIGVVKEMLGRRAVAIYVTVICVMALGLGWFVDWLYVALALTPAMRHGAGAHDHLTSGPLGLALGAALLLATAWAFGRRLWTRRPAIAHAAVAGPEPAEASCCHHDS